MRPEYDEGTVKCLKIRSEELKKPSILCSVRVAAQWNVMQAVLTLPVTSAEGSETCLCRGPCIVREGPVTRQVNRKLNYTQSGRRIFRSQLHKFTELILRYT